MIKRINRASWSWDHRKGFEVYTTSGIVFLNYNKEYTRLAYKPKHFNITKRVPSNVITCKNGSVRITYNFRLNANQY